MTSKEKLTNNDIAYCIENDCFIEVNPDEFKPSLSKEPTFQELYVKLNKYEQLEEKLGISILDFYKILQARHIWAEIGLDLTNRFDELVLFDIKEFDVELNRILLKENKYNLRSIPFNMYKICFWLSRDKSE